MRTFEVRAYGWESSAIYERTLKATTVKRARKDFIEWCTVHGMMIDADTIEVLDVTGE